MQERRVIYGATPEEAQFYQDLVARHGSPLLVLNPQVLRDQYHALVRALPDVDHYYAIKALPHPAVMDCLDELDCGFDVASAGEMDMLAELQVSGRRCIHTHPIKKNSEIRDALRFGATTFVVDNLDELMKLVPYRGRVGVLLRVSFRSENARVDLSKKFGCLENDVPEIVREAEKVGLHIKGLSFHVGSQCANADKHVSAIRRCADLMHAVNEFARSPMSVLDIGGGFPADYELQGLDIYNFCAPIRKALDELPDDWHLLAEPGRFLVAPAVTGITSVIGKSIRGGTPWYYLDDGVYGSFSGQIFDHTNYPIQFLHDGPRLPSVLAGPTCDSIDIVGEGLDVPELKIGDLIIGHRMGAYTAATKTRFNCLPDAEFIVLEEENAPRVATG